MTDAEKNARSAKIFFQARESHPPDFSLPLVFACECWTWWARLKNFCREWSGHKITSGQRKITGQCQLFSSTAGQRPVRKNIIAPTQPPA